MAEVATIVFNSERLGTNGSSPLGEPVDFDVKGLGLRLPRTDAPEGWIKEGRTSPVCRQNQIAGCGPQELQATYLGLKLMRL